MDELKPKSINAAANATSKPRGAVKSTVAPKLVGQRPQPSDGAGDLQKEKLKALINLETAVRGAKNVKELSYIISNNSRAVLPARQVFVFQQKKRNSYRLTSVSSVAEVEKSSFLVRAMEKAIAQKAKSGDLHDATSFSVMELPEARHDEWKNYPFKELLWQPFSSAKYERFAGMLLAKEAPWSEGDRTVSAHLADIYSHGWRGLVGDRKLRKTGAGKRIVFGAALVAIAFAAFIPVPLTALAPAEIVARNSTMIAAPIDGIIKELRVAPNERVAQGQPLIAYEDASLKNDVVVAEKNVEIATARERQFNQSAFSDEQANRQLTVATSELALAQAQLAYNRDVLRKAIVKAPVDGIAVFEDADEWKGKPVQIGTRIMTLADPANVELEISLPVSDAIVLAEGERVRFFLDTSPLDPLEARIESASYQATATASGVLAYTITATLEAEATSVPRIGLRGVAQVFGEDVPLYFYLFRKPIAALRQFFGV